VEYWSDGRSDVELFLILEVFSIFQYSNTPEELFIDDSLSTKTTEE